MKCKLPKYKQARLIRNNKTTNIAVVNYPLLSKDAIEKRFYAFIWSRRDHQRWKIKINFSSTSRRELLSSEQQVNNNSFASSERAIFIETRCDCKWEAFKKNGDSFADEKSKS